MRAAKACSDPHCPNTQPCPTHQRKPWEGSTRRKRLPKGWEKRRRYILQRDPICRICGNALSCEVDHIVPGDDNSPDNLQGVDKACHKRKTSLDARTRAPIPVVLNGPPFTLALIGHPATGKSWLGERLSKRLRWPYRTIDDCGPRGAYEDRWTTMLLWLRDQKRPAITESNVVPGHFTRFLNATNSLVVQVTAPLDVQQQRIDERGEDYLNLDGYLGRPADLTLEANDEAVETLAETVGHGLG